MKYINYFSSMIIGLILLSSCINSNLQQAADLTYNQVEYEQLSELEKKWLEYDTVEIESFFSMKRIIITDKKIIKELAHYLSTIWVNNRRHKIISTMTAAEFKAGMTVQDTMSTYSIFCSPDSDTSSGYYEISGAFINPPKQVDEIEYILSSDSNTDYILTKKNIEYLRRLLNDPLEDIYYE